MEATIISGYAMIIMIAIAGALWYLRRKNDT